MEGAEEIAQKLLDPTQEKSLLVQFWVELGGPSLGEVFSSHQFAHSVSGT